VVDGVKDWVMDYYRPGPECTLDSLDRRYNIRKNSSGSDQCCTNSYNRNDPDTLDTHN
jgi:hypothetical protein